MKRLTRAQTTLILGKITDLPSYFNEIADLPFATQITIVSDISDIHA